MMDLTDYVTSDDSEPVQRRSSQQRMGSMSIVAHHNTGENAVPGAPAGMRCIEQLARAGPFHRASDLPAHVYVLLQTAGTNLPRSPYMLTVMCCVDNIR
jgi:hypothetical protein